MMAPAAPVQSSEAEHVASCLRRRRSRRLAGTGRLVRQIADGLADRFDPVDGIVLAPATLLSGTVRSTPVALSARA